MIDWETVPVHPIVETFPEMSPEEYGALIRDIREHGVRVPIVISDGCVVDGRTRLKAIRDLASQGFNPVGISVQPLFVEWDGVGSLVNWVHSLNYHRRHLTYTQKVLIGAGYAERIGRERPQGYRSDLRANSGVLRIVSEFGLDESAGLSGESVNIAGAIAGVSGNSIHMARRIMRERPDLLDLMRCGGITMWDAMRIVKGGGHGGKDGPGNSRPYNLSRSSRRLIKLMASIDDMTEDEFLNQLVLRTAQARGLSHAQDMVA